MTDENGEDRGVDVNVGKGREADESGGDRATMVKGKVLARKESGGKVSCKEESLTGQLQGVTNSNSSKNNSGRAIRINVGIKDSGTNLFKHVGNEGNTETGKYQGEGGNIEYQNQSRLLIARPFKKISKFLNIPLNFSY